jgi:hypothetical protein
MNDVIKISNAWNSFVYKNKETAPKNSEELELCLKYAPEGCVINLIDGEYVGEFWLNQNNVQVTGVLGKTVLKSINEGHGLTITGNNCTFSNLQIIQTSSNDNYGMQVNGDKNTLQNIDFIGGYQCLFINGDDNQICPMLVTE